jgi:hypothetical protein
VLSLMIPTNVSKKIHGASPNSPRSALLRFKREEFPTLRSREE